jgi:hypothetical protein
VQGPTTKAKEVKRCEDEEGEPSQELQSIIFGSHDSSKETGNSLYSHLRGSFYVEDESYSNVGWSIGGIHDGGDGIHDMELGRDVGGIHHDSIEAHNMEIGIDAIGIYGCACDTQGMEVGGHINDNQHIVNNTNNLTS